MKAILIVREAGEFSEILRRAGFETFHFEAIRTVPIEDFGELDRKIENIGNYEGLFFTSPAAAEVFLEHWRARKEKNFAGKIYVLGNRARKVFENEGFEIVFRDAANTAEELIESFDRAEFAGKKILFLRGDKSLRAVPEILGGAAQIDEAILYRTLEIAPDDETFAEISERLRRAEIAWTCFFSPSGIESFLKAFGIEALKTTKLAAIGSTTARRAVEKGLKVAFVPTRATAKDFAVELIERLKKD